MIRFISYFLCYNSQSKGSDLVILYNCRTKKLPLSPDFIYNNSNALKMFRYDWNLMSNVGNNDNQQRVTEDVYYTYTTLVAFNNSLEKGGISAFDIIGDYLSNHKEITQSKDRKCQTYYEKMELWYKRYMSNPTPEQYQIICDEVQQLMKFLTKQEIIKESGCNLKRNYY